MATELIAADVPLPSRLGENKFYLPTFDLVATVPTQEGAEGLECGLMSLIQYRGNPIGDFNAVLGFPRDDPCTDPFEHDDHSRCPIALATRLQLQSTNLIGDPVKHPKMLLDLAPEGHNLEDWEVRYLQATAHYIQRDWEACTSTCLANLRLTPTDAFSARMLFLATYLGEDFDALCDWFGAISADYETAIAKQDEAVAKGEAPKHALHLALPSLMAWAAFGLEETKRGVPRAEVLAQRAVDLTADLNKKYFPSGKPSVDMPNRRGAFASVEDDTGFACVYGVHAMCHCLETRGDPQAGIDYVNSVDPKMWCTSGLLAGHVWWHLALFYLETGNIEDSLRIFAEQHANPETRDAFSLADSTALMLRIWLWTSYFRHAPGEGNAAWGRATLTQQAEHSVSKALLGFHRQWAQHPESATSQIVFFDTHKQLAHAAAAWIDAEALSFKRWPVPDAPLPLVATGITHGSLVMDPQVRRTALVDGVRMGSSSIQAAAKAQDAKEAETLFIRGLAEWLALVDRLSPPKPASAIARTALTAGPMGGSVAQQTVLSFNLLLIWALSDRRDEAAVTLKCLTQSHTSSKLVEAVVSASGI